MALTTYKRVVLNSRPDGDIQPDTFRIETRPFSELKPGEGQALVQCTYLSLDPAMRGYIRDVRSYMPPVQIGELMRARGIGVVIATGPGSSLKVGDHVEGPWGMQEYAVVKDKDVVKLDVTPGIQPLDYINVLGSSGLTAYVGLKKIGKIKPGEKLVVSGAAGSVGIPVCQLGKAAGAKVYAIAGGPQKCKWLEEEIGVDKALDYKSPTFYDDVKKHIGYLDVFFDNVGGEILDFMLTRLKQNARIVLCGAISGYNSARPRGLQSYLNLISQRATLQGFIYSDYAHTFPAALEELKEGLRSGKIKSKFHIVSGGIEAAPRSLPLLFSGGNTGKLVVKISEEPKLQAKL